MVDWLSHVSCDDRHNELCQNRSVYPDSTRWIYKDLQVCEWLWESETSNLILWVVGIPGSGKLLSFPNNTDINGTHQVKHLYSAP